VILHKKKLDEEKLNYGGLAQEIGLGLV